MSRNRLRADHRPLSASNGLVLIPVEITYAIPVTEEEAKASRTYDFRAGKIREKIQALQLGVRINMYMMDDSDQWAFFITLRAELDGPGVRDDIANIVKKHITDCTAIGKEYAK